MREWDAPPGRGGRWREKPLTGAHVAGDMLGPRKSGLTDRTLRRRMSGTSRTARRRGRTGRTHLVVAGHGEACTGRAEREGVEGVGGRKLRAVFALFDLLIPPIRLELSH